jgi:hypothetical protein
MSRTWATLGLLAALCAGIQAAGAEGGPSPTPVPSLALGDGRVLHHAVVMDDAGSMVVIRSDEGLVEVSKALLPGATGTAAPPAVAAGPETGLVMPAFNPDQGPPGEPEARPKPAQKPQGNVAPKPLSPSGAAFRSCTLASFEMKAFQNILGCAEVSVRNDGDSPVVLHPGDFACVLEGGSRRPGRNFISTQSQPAVVGRREVVGPGATAEFLVTFADEALEITAVQWAR